jgi:hypothetical protein
MSHNKMKSTWFCGTLHFVMSFFPDHRHRRSCRIDDGVRRYRLGWQLTTAVSQVFCREPKVRQRKNTLFPTVNKKTHGK